MNNLIHTQYKKMLADTVTPVGIYQNIRKNKGIHFLLESSDYHGNDNSYSFICTNPVAEFKVENGVIYIQYPNQNTITKKCNEVSTVDELNDFAQHFKPSSDFDFISNGLFGFIAFEGVEHFDKYKLEKKIKESKTIPDLQYFVFQNIIVINHFKNELHLLEHQYNGNLIHPNFSNSDMEKIIFQPSLKSGEFKKVGEENTNFTDDEFIALVQKAKEHCQRGDVFQLVVSREFSQKFEGDDFTLYRALRSINPSPYLFYFDFNDFKIFGSSPEAQIVIKNKKATIFPIAGTFRRTGDDEKDAVLAQKLLDDPKENAEHVMLVDLARNDLSRDCKGVTVEKYREVQFYSHVIHLVSQVSGNLQSNKNTIRLVADTFPAGTLSGAPKHKAVELINQYEKNQRSMYGGAIGYLGFNGDFNHAIIIRSFLSKNNELFYQAGAGVVNQSNDESEKQEVFNKLAALHKALNFAEEI
jgi:anthranilate synthase component 1